MSNFKFSYSGNPASSQKDEVRFLVGDTNADAPLISDDEIKYLLSQAGSPVNAAIQAAYSLVAKFSRSCDETVGAVSKSYGQRAESFRKLAKDLQKQQAIDGCIPYAGGISLAEKVAAENNTDRVDNFFYRDLHNESLYAAIDASESDE